MRATIHRRTTTWLTALTMCAAPALLAACGDSQCAELSFGIDNSCDSDFLLPPQPGVPDPGQLTEPVVAARALQPGTEVLPWTSSRALAVHRDTLYVVDRDNGRLVVLSREGGEILDEFEMGARPHHVVVAPDGTAWVTVRHDGTLVKVTPDGRTFRKVVGGGPTALALSHDRRRLYVSLTESGRVVALDPNSLEESGSVSLTRPRAVVTTPNGDVHVASGDGTTVLEPQLADGALRLRVKTRVDLRQRNPIESVFFGAEERDSSANGALAAVLDPETGSALVTHQIIFPGNRESALADAQPQPEFSPRGRDTSYGGGGGGRVGRGSLFDSVPPRPAEVTVSRSGHAQGKRTSSASLNGFPTLAASPLDINHHPTHTIAVVAANGTSEVLFFNTRMDDPFAAPLAVADVAEGPTAVAFSPDGEEVYVLAAHEFVVARVSMRPLLDRSEPYSAKDAPLALRHRPQLLSMSDRFPYGADPLSPSAQLGRRIFTQNRYSGLSGDGKFACQTCHIEGTDDGAVWFGKIGPRQTPSLAGRLHDTGPFNWRGSERRLQDNFKRTVLRMGGNGLHSNELTALEAFILEDLTPPRNPYQRADGLTAQQTRGRALFNDPSVGCASCHSGTALTDGRSHDVGTLTQLEIELDRLGAFDEADPGELGVYDTPSLRDVYRTAPYFHDGSAATLEQALDMTATTMGRTAHLTRDQKADLIAYLRTL